MSQAGPLVTNSSTVIIPGNVPTTFVTDVNSPAIPAANILNEIGRDTTTNNIYGIQTDGSSGSNTLTVQLTNRFHGSGTTTDATPTTIATCPMSTNPATFQFEINLVAYDVTDNSSLTDKTVISFRTTGGVPVLLDEENHITQEDAGALFPVTSQIDYNGTSTNFNVIVTGAVGKTIKWLCHGTYTVVS